MHLRQGFGEWLSNLERIQRERCGIERVVGMALYCLTLFTPTEWVHMGWGTKDKPLGQGGSGPAFGAIHTNTIEGFWRSGSTEAVDLPLRPIARHHTRRSEYASIASWMGAPVSR